MSRKTGGRAEYQSASCQESDTAAGFLVVLREFAGLLGMTAKSGAGRWGGRPARNGAGNAEPENYFRGEVAMTVVQPQVLVLTAVAITAVGTTTVKTMTVLISTE